MDFGSDDEEKGYPCVLGGLKLGWWPYFDRSMKIVGLVFLGQYFIIRNEVDSLT